MVIIFKKNMDNYALKTILRFLNTIDETNNCWLWKKGKSIGKYGLFHAYKTTFYAHRYSYELFKGEIPEGYEVDHLCRNTSCVNPDHLEAVTRRENIDRSDWASAINSRKTHCPKGHELKGDNLDNYQKRLGYRKCRICKNERDMLYYQNNREVKIEYAQQHRLKKRNETNKKA